MNIIIKSTLIGVYYFIDIVEHYYKLLWQVFSIIITKILAIKSNSIF